MNMASGQSGYVWYLDFNSNGHIDNLDFANFRGQMGNRLGP
jgi:hypothetical protein